MGFQNIKSPNYFTKAINSLQKWKTEAEEMKVILDHSHESAQKMTSHADADAKYAAYKKRWEVIDATAKDWISKYEKMVEVWKKQAETAEKVTAAISAKPAPAGEGGAAPEMKLEDLEKHLNALKEMFIQKQAMMEELEKTTAAPGPADAAPAAPAPEAPPAAPAPAPEVAAN